MLKGLKEFSPHLIQKIDQNRVSTGNRSRALKVLSNNPLKKIDHQGRLTKVSIVGLPKKSRSHSKTRKLTADGIRSMRAKVKSKKTK